MKSLNFSSILISSLIFRRAVVCSATSSSTSLTYLLESCAVSGGSSSQSSSNRINHKRSISSSSSSSSSSNGSSNVGMRTAMMRVAYQGEPGAYSEKATRELLGDNVIAIGRPDFESCFRAVANRECEYACLPIENSLGGSIHENYDLMLRYDLTIVAEHEFRVKHCLLARPGVPRENIRYAISHPQALAQCDNYLRGLGIKPIPMYDTAGSAKMIAEGSSALPEQCTPENTCAIASDLAGRTYGLNCLEKGIEDDDTNFTRFLLLARKGVSNFLNSRTIPSKTSVVFTLPNTAGALYKALACFSLRDIDFSKIESRPTSASLLNFLKYRSEQKRGKLSKTTVDTPRFRYCFYLDFLASSLDENAEHALNHLREQADFVRILGSYPQKSRLVGPVADEVEELKNMPIDPISMDSLPSDSNTELRLKIGFIGFGPFGQSLAQRFKASHDISCIDKVDLSLEAQKMGVDFYHNYEMTNFLSNLDVVVLAVPLVDFEDIVLSLPADRLRGKLVVEVCPLNAHPKAILLQHLGPDVDILSSHPMLGSCAHDDPYSGATWENRPMVYEKVRVLDMRRCEAFLNVFSESRCKMVEMTAEQHDDTAADAEFVTQLTGRLLSDLPATPVSSKEYTALCDIADATSEESFDLFFGMFKFNHRAKDYLNKMRENLAKVERQLASKEAYLAATAEMKSVDRQRLIAETKILLQDILRESYGKSDDLEGKKIFASPIVTHPPKEFTSSEKNEMISPVDLQIDVKEHESPLKSESPITKTKDII